MKRWTQDEIETLKKYYPSHGSKYCSKWINRSLMSIRQRTNMLGLSTCIVTNGLPQKQILKKLDNNQVIALCKKHRETPHYLQNGKISGCVKCNYQLMTKRANTDEGKAYLKEAQKKYRSTLVGKLACRLRVSLRSALKSKNITKTQIGCFRLLSYSPQELTQHLEDIRLFQNNQCPMCYRSYNTNKWTIDHITPIKRAKTKEDVLKLFNLNNLSLLCQSCNSSKGVKICL